MNRDIIQELERLRQRYDEEGDDGREQAYSRAIDSVRQHNKPIRSGKEAMELQGIANGIGWRIDQVLGTQTVEGKDQQSSQTKKPTKPAKKPPAKIPPAKKPLAKRQSKKAEASITDVQEPRTSVRVTFCDDDSGHQYRKKVKRKPTPNAPRKQVIENNGVSREGAIKLLRVIQDVAQGSHVVLADEFRRGNHDLSRLLFLFTEKSLPRSTRRSEKDMKCSVETLEEAKVFKDIEFNLNSPRPRVDATAVFKSGKSIKCILLSIPAIEWPFALIRYTGPLETWKQLQRIAESRGCRLTERSLTDASGAVTEICRTEKEIFQRLGIVYIPPEER